MCRSISVRTSFSAQCATRRTNSARRSARIRLIIVFSLILCAALPAILCAQDQKPDIIFILLDDMNADMLAHMDRLQSEMAGRGTTFENFFISTPMCCPSRVNFLLGNYSHNHGVWEVKNSCHGGWHAFRFPLNGMPCESGSHGPSLEESVVVKALQQDLGYRTAYMGKFFNWFPNDINQVTGTLNVRDDQDFDPDAEPQQSAPGFKLNDVPPYWTSWYALLAGEPSMFAYYGSRFNECDDCMPGENGAVVVPTAEDVYSTDYLREKAVQLILTSNDFIPRPPLFLWIAPVAPHKRASGPYPLGPTRYDGDYSDVSWPEKPSLLESDRRDKPAWIQNLELKPTIIDGRNEYFRHALRSLKAVEDLLFGEEDGPSLGVLDALAITQRLDNTYIFVASDNGYHYGEHHMHSGKRSFFEEDVRIPLLVRGPGVPEGRVLRHLTGNIDLGRTFLELAGGNGPIAMDGRSLVPLLRPAAMPEEDWRQVFLLERRFGTGPPRPPGNSYALRMDHFKFIEHLNTIEEQLYDLNRDPYEERSLHTESTESTRIALRSSLTDLKDCKGLSCRGFENRKPEVLERRFVAALFNPCITPGGTCSTTIVWDTRFFENDYAWIRTQFGGTFRCLDAGDVGSGQTGNWDWGGSIRLDVYDTMTACDSGDFPPASDWVQSVTIPRADEPTVRPTGQLVALPNPCFPDAEGRCQVTVFLKTQNFNEETYDRVEVRHQYGGLWLSVPVNSFQTALTDNWRTGRKGNELSLFPGKTGTELCPSPCDISNPNSNLGPRLDFENIYSLE